MSRVWRCARGFGQLASREHRPGISPVVHDHRDAAHRAENVVEPVRPVAFDQRGQRIRPVAQGADLHVVPFG
jgi:hypothetical protein